MNKQVKLQKMMKKISIIKSECEMTDLKNSETKNDIYQSIIEFEELLQQSGADFMSVCESFSFIETLYESECLIQYFS
jgi:hypothetical protein